MSSVNEVDLIPGGDFTLYWEDAVGPVTLRLMKFYDSDIQQNFVTFLEGATNSSYTWHVPADLPADSYTFEVEDGYTKSRGRVFKVDSVKYTTVTVEYPDHATKTTFTTISILINTQPPSTSILASKSSNQALSSLSSSDRATVRAQVTSNLQTSAQNSTLAPTFTPATQSIPESTNPKELSTATKVTIGVVSPTVVLAALAMIFILRRHKAKDLEPQSMKVNIPEVHGEAQGACELAAHNEPSARDMSRIDMEDKESTIAKLPAQLQELDANASIGNANVVYDVDNVMVGDSQRFELADTEVTGATRL